MVPPIYELFLPQVSHSSALPRESIHLTSTTKQMAFTDIMKAAFGLLFGYDQGVIANVLVMREFRGKFGLNEWEEGVVSEYD